MPSFEYEDKLSGVIVGVDEAGRGPWAGPVAAGAVIIKNRNLDEFLLKNLNDSKKISPKKREAIYEKLLEAKEKGQVLLNVGWASVEEIDELNILQATFLAMKRAVEGLSEKADWAIVDGNQKPKGLNLKIKTLIKGDALSYSVAAASIMAKVARDRIMKELGQKYPEYGFESNAGYGTKVHIEALKNKGIINSVHRKSYAPIKKILENKAA